MLHNHMQDVGVTLVTTTDQYCAAHYYPLTYKYFSHLSPKAVWFPVTNASNIDEALIDEAVLSLCGVGVDRVMIKDFVKSAKDVTEKFSYVSLHSEMKDRVQEFV